MSRRKFLRSPAAWLILLPLPALLVWLVFSPPPPGDPAVFLPAGTVFWAEGEAAQLFRLAGPIAEHFPALFPPGFRAGFALPQLLRFFPRFGLALLPAPGGRETPVLIVADGIFARLLGVLAAASGEKLEILSAGGCLAFARAPLAGLGLPAPPETSLAASGSYRRAREAFAAAPPIKIFLRPAAWPGTLAPALLRPWRRPGDFLIVGLGRGKGISLRAWLGNRSGPVPGDGLFLPPGDGAVSLSFRRPGEILQLLNPALDPARRAELDLSGVAEGRLEIRRVLEAFPFPLVEAALTLRFSGEEAAREFSGRLTRKAAGAGLTVSRRRLPGGDFTVVTIFPGYSPGWTIFGRDLKAVFPLSAGLLEAPASEPSAPPGLEAAVSLDSFDSEVAPALGALLEQISPSWGKGFQTGRKLAAALAGPEGRYRLSLVLGEGGILLEIAAP